LLLIVVSLQDIQEYSNDTQSAPDSAELIETVSENFVSAFANMFAIIVQEYERLQFINPLDALWWAPLMPLKFQEVPLSHSLIGLIIWVNTATINL